MELFEKLLIFQEGTLRARKINQIWKNFLFFGKWNFLAPSLKNLYFRRKLAKLEKTKSSSHISRWLLIKCKIVSCNGFTIITAVKIQESFTIITAARENPCEANTAASYQEN